MRDIDDEYDGRCPRCGSGRWVSVSLDGAYTRLPQCVPCGAYHGSVRLGPGSEHPSFNRQSAEPSPSQWPGRAASTSRAIREGGEGA